MTTPPKVRRFHLSRSESPVAAARDAARDGAGSADGTAPRAPDATPQVRVEVRRGAAIAAANAPETGKPDQGVTAVRADNMPFGAPSPAAGPTVAAARPAGPPTDGSALAPPDDGFGGMIFPGGEPADDRAAPSGRAQPDAGPAPERASASAETAADSQPAAPPQPADALAEALAAIRAENLTSRQLRMAARIAAMHEIEVASEYEAVLRLRERGIDPFHRNAVGKILSTEGTRTQAEPSPTAPAVVPGPNVPARRRKQEIAPLDPNARPDLPSREALTEERRAAEIYRIQRDIAARRRKRFVLLMTRLAFFVGLPTLIAGWYYFTIATPLYATYAQFQIQQAEGNGGGDLGGLFSGTQLATNPDSVAVQSYLSSRDAMMRLDQDLGFMRAFQDPAIDPVKRLASDATREEAYALYQDSVKISYDPTEGMINMEVIAPDPNLSEKFSLALIGYAEGQIDQMTARLRDDQMKGAVDSFNDAERKVQEAQGRVQQLQEKMGVLDPMAEGSVVMGRIATLEGQLSEKRLELGQLQANARPNQSRVQGVQGDIRRLEEMIATTRQQLTETTGNRASLASITGELRIADSDLVTRQQLLATAAAQMETARIEANKQVRYLSLSVAPVPPDAATYPKALQNTLVAFFIFSGIYLMMSLTASILREQVST